MSRFTDLFQQKAKPVSPEPVVEPTPEPVVEVFEEVKKETKVTSILNRIKKRPSGN